jgi:hypothetical protein
MKKAGFVDSSVDKKVLGLLFWIRLRAAPEGCRNLLRTPARESGTGTESRIRTVRQLAAAAGDGWLGSIGSPGSAGDVATTPATQWAPATHTWRGPRSFVWACCSRPLLGLLLAPTFWACCSRPLFGLAARASRARHPPSSSSHAEESASAHSSSPRRARDLPTLAATPCSPSDPARDLPTLAATSRTASGPARFADARSYEPLPFPAADGPPGPATRIAPVIEGLARRLVRLRRHGWRPRPALSSYARCRGSIR